MKYVLLALLISGPIWGLLTRVRDRNVAVATGQAAYARGDASRAATAFAAALAATSRKVPDPSLLLNLAHAQVRAGQVAAAQNTYSRLLAGSPAPVASVAHQQLAVLAVRRGEVAQALSLLRQALLQDPRNDGARFDYEALSNYLAQRPAGPKIPPPAQAPAPAKPQSSPDKNAAEKNRPAEKAGTDHQGQANQPEPAPAPTSPPERRPDPAGQPDKQRPGSAPGNAARGGLAPGQGSPQNLGSGDTPGTERGLDRSGGNDAPSPHPTGGAPGSEAAAPTDIRLQTQRERLRAMNLSPAQARQLLETLRAQEQQYLQQLTRPTAQKPDPSKPTW